MKKIFFLKLLTIVLVLTSILVMSCGDDWAEEDNTKTTAAESTQTTTANSTTIPVSQTSQTTTQPVTKSTETRTTTLPGQNTTTSTTTPPESTTTSTTTTATTTTTKTTKTTTTHSSSGGGNNNSSTTTEPTTNFITLDNPSKVNEGDTFDVKVIIKNALGVNAYQFQLQYDPEVLEIIGEEGMAGIEPGTVNGTELPVDIWGFKPDAGVPGNFIVAGHLLANQFVTGNGYLAVIHFKTTGSSGQSSDFTFHDVFLYGIDGNKIPVDYETAGLKVTIK